MRCVIVLFALASLECCASAGQGEPVRNATALALVGATIYPSPGADSIGDGVVLIEDGTIAAVGPRRSVALPEHVETVDVSGRFITAGFWNSHVHFFERKWTKAAEIPAEELGRQLSAMSLEYGFTSVFDTGSPWENTRALRDRIEAGEVQGPRIRSTGEAIIARDALPSDVVFRVMGLMTYPTPEITEASEAAAAAKVMLDAGTDGVKVHLQPPPPPKPAFPEAAIAAAVKEAHARERPVFAHPNTAADVIAAAGAGVDVIAHTTPHSGPWDEATLRAMTEASVALTPTLTLWRSFLRHDRVSVQEGVVDTAVGQLRAFVEAGGTVVFGTDLGAVDYDPREEYALMARAGMGFPEILASLTVAPAARFGDSDRLGRIEPGFTADLVVLTEDPSRAAEALADVELTLRQGRIVYRR